MAVTNKAASILTRLKNQAKEQNISSQICLQLFAQEEFLRRLSASEYKDKMILKGGMFIYTLTEFESRPTRDIDFLVKQLPNDPAMILKIMSKICSISTENDFINIEALDTAQITLDKKYPGVKTKFMAYISNVRIPFSIDIGINDVIIPGPVLRHIPTRLEEFVEPEIYTYSLESTIAEKLDAILQRMETTSRMKDFYDIYYLSGIFNFSGDMLQKAIIETTKHRGHVVDRDVFSRIKDFPTNQFILTQWKAFHPAKEIGISIDETINNLLQFLEPVVLSIIENCTFEKQWISTGRIWK